MIIVSKVTLTTGAGDLDPGIEMDIKDIGVSKEEAESLIKRGVVYEVQPKVKKSKDEL